MLSGPEGQKNINVAGQHKFVIWALKSSLPNSPPPQTPTHDSFLLQRGAESPSQIFFKTCKIKEGGIFFREKDKQGHTSILRLFNKSRCGASILLCPDSEEGMEIVWRIHWVHRSVRSQPSHIFSMVKPFASGDGHRSVTNVN